jgi:hypothetical protein
MRSQRGPEATQQGIEMFEHTFWRRAKRAAIGLGLAALLAGCFFAPGKFASQLDLRKNGSFTFTYQGEITLLALSRLAEMSNQKAEFTAEPCHDEDYNDRPCTKDELAEQRADWDEQQKSKAEEDKRNAQMAQSLLGGIDPNDPKAAQEIADRLNRQKGWSNVTYKGNGLFTVDYSIASTMSHDFVFPVFEGFPMANNFVTATLRDGNSVRIEAPGFTGQSLASNPMGGMLGAATASEAKGGDKDQSPAPAIDGTFKITTDGAILTNNTDEGPAPTATGQQLVWTINQRTANAPVALIRLGN